MTQIFNESGNRIAVSVVEAGPCMVLQKMTPAKHKYSAIQIGFGDIPERRVSKPRRRLIQAVESKGKQIPQRNSNDPARG